ncbi:hypothetical protein ACLB2K_039255 [Fragaria x ananassa]
MEKSIILSKACQLSLLIVIAACLPFSLAARAPAPVDDVSPNLRACSTFKDCEGITCDSVIWHVECVNGSCHCIPNVPVDDVVASEPAPPVEVDDVPPIPRTCSTGKDCKGISCDVDSVVWHAECVKGTCHCEPHMPACSTVQDCKGIRCDSVNSHAECVNGICQCVPNVPVDDVLEAEPEPVDEEPPTPVPCSTVNLNEC